MMIISYFGLFLMIGSCLFAIYSEKINFPCWLDLIFWLFIISCVAIIINDNKYVNNLDAEIMLRLVGSIMLSGLIYISYKRGKNK